MRALFYCLVVVNLAVFGWFMLFDNTSTPDQPPRPGGGSLELLGDGAVRSHNLHLEIARGPVLGIPCAA